jgi:hypothetical protein
MSEIAGLFHSGRVVRGLPEALREWRVTTNERDVAERVSRLLGGDPVEGGADGGGWEVLTGAGTVRIVVERADNTSLAFRLAEDYPLGVFEFRSGVWSLVQVIGDAVARLSGLGVPALCELGIGPVLLTTAMGTHVRYFRPSLRVMGRWVAAA